MPYSPATDKLISRDVIAAMKPTAFLINLARGGVLDEAALIDHLRAGKIAGAGRRRLFQAAAAGPIIRFWTMPNVIITPNIGGRSDCFVEQTLTIVAPNMQAFIDGRANEMRNIVAH